jgi:hypothetical protein
MSHTAFFYGTLMAPSVLHRVIWGNTSPPETQKSMLHIRPAILHSYQRYKVKYADYPAIIPSHESFSVRGTLVTGLNEGDIWRLDIFEGSEYKRCKVRVKVLKQKEGEREGMGDLTQREEDNIEGEEVEAEVYEWVAGIKRLEIEEWNFQEFVKEKLHRWAGAEAADADEGFQGRQSILGKQLVGCAEYVGANGLADVDSAVAALEDSTGGRGANGSITRTLEANGSAREDIIANAV